MKIRPPQDHDREEWLSLRRELWPRGSKETHLEEMEEYLHGSSFQVFVAEGPEGGLCGFAEAALRAHADGCDTRPVGYLEGIFVRPDFRGRGLGHCLVEAAENWARAQGCREMASDCLYDNESSIRFHQKLGFEIAEQLIHFKKRLLGPSFL